MLTRSQLVRRLAAIVLVLATIWVVSVAGFLQQELPYRLALIPRTAQWWGIITSPLVHRDLTHLLANTAPLIVFLGLLQIKGNRTFITVLSVGWLLGGMILWLLGRAGAHIGASGLVFALFGYLLASSLVERRLIDVVIAIVVAAGYWGMLWGLVPGGLFVSWDGHLAGLIGGCGAAWLVGRTRARSRAG